MAEIASDESGPRREQRWGAPGRSPVSPYPAVLGRPAAGAGGSDLDGTRVVSCWLCGIHMPADRMIADGGSACGDVRWYCDDTESCTWRWTARSAGPVGVAATVASAPGERAGQSAATRH
jgi:hypothetical protein